MTKEDLIKHYERHLEIVKQMHSYTEQDSDLKKDKCKSYIECAEKDLEAVKNGRGW